MTEFLELYWPYLLVVLGLLLLATVLLRGRTQRVELTRDEDSVRPTLARTLPPKAQPPVSIDIAPAAPEPAPAAPPRPQPVPATSAQLTEAIGELSELRRLKGIGPKLASLLNAQGIFTISDLARLDEGELAQVDAQLGSFKGRLQRDRIIEQARLLDTGDVAGYEAKFGKLNG